MTKNGTRRRLSIGLGLPRSSSNSAVFFGFSDLAAERKSRNRFVSAGFVSGGVFGAPCLFLPKSGLQKVVIKFSVKRKVQNYFFEPCFRMFRTIFVAHRFWGWVFLRCVARFWVVSRAEHAILGPLGEVATSPLWRFWVRSRCGAVRFAAEIPTLPAVSRGCIRKCRSTWQGLTSSATNPLETAEINILGLGGGCLMISPNFAEKSRW